MIRAEERLCLTAVKSDCGELHVTTISGKPALHLFGPEELNIFVCRDFVPAYQVKTRGDTFPPQIAQQKVPERFRLYLQASPIRK
jgi:hypothetical protein